MNKQYIYLYKQTMDINLTTSVLTAGRQENVYSRNMTLYRGIDNTVSFNFRNNDQKKVNMLDKVITFNIIDNESHITHLTRPMTLDDGPNGIAKLVISESDLLDINEQYYTWSVKVVDGENVQHVAYTDDNYSAAGQLQVKHGVFPEFRESVSLAFTGGTVTSAAQAYPRLNNNNNALHTAQFYFTEPYTGSVTIQGTMDDVANQTTFNWVDINTVSYTAQTGNAYVNWTGVFSAIRFVKADTTNTVSSVLYRH